MDVFLDIGFTLMGGPRFSPPKMVVEIFKLHDKPHTDIYDIVFAQNHADPGSLVESIENSFKISTSQDQAERLTEFWNQQYTDCFPIEWANEFLDNLIKDGTCIHLVSNLWFPFYDRFTQIFRSHLESIKTETLSFREGRRKPDPTFYALALSKSKAKPEDSFSIGDSVKNDIEPFLNLRIDSILFHSRKDRNGQLGLDIRGANLFEVKSLKEAYNIIRK